MNATEYLDNIIRMRKMIDAKKMKIQALRDIATNTTSTISDMPRNPSPSQSKMADAVAKIVDLEAEVAELEKKRGAAIAKISELPNDTYSALLIKHYVQELPWEVVADDLFVSRRQVFRIRKSAEDELEKLALLGT